MRDFPWHVISVLALTWMWYQAESEVKQLTKEAEAVRVATHERNQAIGRLSIEYSQRLADIDNRPAPAAPERVYVKTSAVRPSGATGLDDGTEPGRVELDRGSVESVTAVTDRWQRDFEKCSVKLEAIQEAIRNQ